MSERRLLVVDLAVKFALVALLLFGAFSGLDRFEGKAMTGRALVYPIATLIVPVVWWLWFRRSRYPYALDILIVLPFLIDTAGNALDLYDSVSWWDDANHLVNWLILVLGFGTVLLRRPSPSCSDVPRPRRCLRTRARLRRRHAHPLGDRRVTSRSSATTGTSTRRRTRTPSGTSRSP